MTEHEQHWQQQEIDNVKADATTPPWTERDQRVIAELKMLQLGVYARACEVQRVARFVPSDEATITALLYELAELRVQVAEMRETLTGNGNDNPGGQRNGQ